MKLFIFTIALVMSISTCSGFMHMRSLYHRSSLRPSRAVAAASRSLSPPSSVAAAGSGDIDDITSSGASSTSTRKKRVLSGIQPSGSLHLGNYLGALKQWVRDQDRYDSYFCVVDLHAITSTSELPPEELRRSTLQSAALYLAAGIDPSKSKIFVQSHVPAHSELSWLLSCITPIGWLQRMTQYKDKVAKQQDASDASLGLFGYPVLMAADILLYGTELVPVGEDQLQHLELARDIAKRFNHKYCKKSSEKVLRLPKAQVVAHGARVMSLQDGSAKMSKSAPDDFSRINLLDEPDVIAAKIKKCKTDLLAVQYDCPDRPECANLVGIYEAVTGLSPDAIRSEIDGTKWGQFKPLLTDAVITHLKPMQLRYRDIVSDPANLERILTQGAEAASAVANQTLYNAKRHIGFSFPGDKLDLAAAVVSSSTTTKRNVK